METELEPVYICECCGKAVADVVGATPPLDEPIICGACWVFNGMQEPQKVAA